MTRVQFRDWECLVLKRQYGNGRVALQLVDAEDGSPVATATVNLAGMALGPNQVAIKDWSENEGMLAALVEAAVVRPVGKTVKLGFVEIPVCELLEPFRGPEKTSGRAR